MKNDFAFLGKNGMKRFVLMFVTMMTLFVCEKVLDYRYIVAQKAVQEGNMSQWHTFLVTGACSIVFSVICTLLVIFSQMWIIKLQKINFFRSFDGFIQTGRKEVCLRKFNFENAKIATIMEIAQAILSMVYTICIMQIVNMTVPQKVGAASILVAGIAFGVRRGQLQQKADNIGAEIQTRQELLSTHLMISSNVLEERLNEIGKGYWRQIVVQIIKNLIKHLPEIIKVVCFFGLMWNISETKISGTPYSYSFIIFTAYGYIVTFANEIGNIVEDASKLVKYSKDNELHMLKAEERAHKKLLEEQGDKIELNDEGLVIESGFTANVSHSDKPDSWYYIPEKLTLKKGEMVELDGENETGKSRLNRFLKEIISGTILYDSNTAISNRLAENFMDGGKFDFQLIKRLAHGIGISGRIPETEEEFRNMSLSKQLNSADLQRLIALQILYFATKEHNANPEKLQVIILDEILANISEQNAKVVLKFVAQILSSLGACTIIVSHTHKEVVREYASQTWYMRNDGDRITIVSK